MGYTKGLVSAALRGPRRILQWPPELTSELTRGSLGGEASAFAEKLDHVAPLRDFYIPFGPIARLEDCESLVIRHETKGAITEKYLVAQFLGNQRALGNV